MFTKSLRLPFKLALLVLPPVMIPLLSIGWFANKDLRDDIYRKALDQMQEGIRLVTNEVGVLIDTAKSNADLLANFPQLKQYMRTEDNEQRQSLLQSSILPMFHGYQHVYPEYHEISFLFPDDFDDMRAIQSARDHHLTENEGVPEYYQRLIQMDEDMITEIRRIPDNGASILTVLRRVYDTSDNRQSATYGYLELTVSLEKLYRDLEKHRIDSKSSILLVDKTGEILFDSHHQSTDTRLPRVIWKLVQTSDYFLRPRKYYFLDQTFLIQAKALDSQLYALVTFPSDELENPILKPRIAVILATLSVLILYTNLVYSGLQRLILRPLRELHHATVEIVNGNYDYVIKHTSTDELGEMANSINRLRKKLASYSQDESRMDDSDAQHREC